MRNRLFIAALAGATLLAGIAEPAAGQASSTSGQAPATYTVRPGDTLYGIARRYGLTVQALAAANNRAVQGFLYAGDVLKVPGTGSAAVAAGGTYTIRTGDTLWGIAQRHHTTLSALMTANGISLTTVLLAGRTLVVPGAVTPTAAPAATTAAVTPNPALTGTATRHRVQAGDSFSSIARRYGVTPQAVAEANGLPLLALITPGQTLGIPAVVRPPGTPAGLPTDLVRRPDALAMIPTFRAAAVEFGVPADLLMSLTYRESGWRPDARSATGAMGIGQLLPATATWLAALMKQPWLDPNVADHNIRMSARLLRWNIDHFGGDVRLALASYFDGPGAVTRGGVTPVADAYATSILDRRAWFA